MDLPSMPDKSPSADTLVRATTLLILLVVLASGPLVPWVAFTQADEDDDYYGAGPGTATVTVVEPPADDFRIAPARFGAGVYLYSAPTTVHIEHVSGTPRLVYEVRLAGLGFNGVSVTFLDEDDAGTTQTLVIERSEVEPDDVTEEAYPAQLELRVRGDQGTQLVYERNVTVSVEDLGGNEP